MTPSMSELSCTHPVTGLMSTLEYWITTDKGLDQEVGSGGGDRLVA